MHNSPAPSLPPKLTEALAFLQAAEQSMQTGDTTRLPWAIQQFDEGLARLQPFAAQNGNARRWLAMAWLARGNAQRARGAAGLAEALRSYDAAVAVIQETTGLADESEALRRHDLATAWTERGLTLLAAGAPDQLAEAVKNFDHAIAQRRDLPSGPHQEFHHGLATGWLNRADALTRLGTADHTAEALRSYDEAIAVLQTLAHAENDALRHRLAVAFMNRGITRQALAADGAATAEALRDFDECIHLLRGHRLCERPEGKHLLACGWLNRAGLLLTDGPAQIAEARAAAREARSLLVGLEEQQPGIADIALKARHALCRAALLRLPETAPGEERSAWLSDATDAVEEGIALARGWERRGLAAFKPMETELFRLGAQLYLNHQPQFLAEFVSENLVSEPAPAAAPDAAMLQIGTEAIARALQNLQSRGFGELGQPGMERTLTALAELRAAEQRLRALRLPLGKL